MQKQCDSYMCRVKAVLPQFLLQVVQNLNLLVASPRTSNPKARMDDNKLVKIGQLATLTIWRDSPMKVQDVAISDYTKATTIS